MENVELNSQTNENIIYIYILSMKYLTRYNNNWNQFLVAALIYLSQLMAEGHTQQTPPVRPDKL